MKEAIRQARKAGKLNEVPIGCVIVRDGKIIARGYNRRNTDLNTLAHAELQAIRKASRVVGDWRLEDCVMYITLEPCQMCAGAIGAGTDSQSRDRKPESKSWMCRFGSGSSACACIQSSGRAGRGRVKGRMFRTSGQLFSGASAEEKGK